MQSVTIPYSHLAEHPYAIVSHFIKKKKEQ